jgi:DNA polymerase III subunit gamma/tau
VQPFVVSARKYRPKTFEDVVGQKHIAETLMHEITQNKLAQAFLFTGPRGVGKTTCARILAKVINSQNGEKSEDDFAFNVFELDAASNNTVDDIRNLIDQVRIPPHIGKYKVYIIDEVHMLSTAAFNAFLKTLEEPPSYAIFILATTERHKILPTILSRCQVFNFNRIQIKDMVEHLANIANKESVEIENAVLHLIAAKADGGLRDALSMFDQLVSFSAGKVTYESAVEMLSILDMDTFFDLTNAALESNIPHSLVTINRILNQGFDGSLILGGFADHFRNLIVTKSPETVQLLDVADVFKEKYKEQTRKMTMGFLLNALNLVNEAAENYKAARNPRLHLELTLIKLCHIQQFVNVIPTLEEVKKKIVDLGNTSTNVPKTTSEKWATPTIKEDTLKNIDRSHDAKKTVEATRLGSLNRQSFKKEKATQVAPNDTSNDIKNDPPLDTLTSEIEISAPIQKDNKVSSNEFVTVDENNKPEIELNAAQPEVSSNHTPLVTADHIRLGLSTQFGIRINALFKAIQAEIEGSDIVFLISSKSHEESLEEKRLEIIRYLKQASQGLLNSFSFRYIEIKETSKKPYTDVEKLTFLTEKHPDLKVAIEKLKLRLP